MTLRRLLFRSLVYHWRTNLPIIAGVAIAVAVLSGALLVGQSVRGSLRNLLYERIGPTEYVISADRFFSEDLASAFAAESCPIIYLKGVAIHEQSRIRVNNVNVYGVDDRFWKLQEATDQNPPKEREALVGAPLAQQLGVGAGDGLLLRIETQQGIPREWLYGRRDDVGRTMRLTCREILAADRLGEFALRPSQGNVYSVFVPLSRVQKDLGQPSRANAILLARVQGGGLNTIRDQLKKKITLQDLGLKLRPLPNGFSVESNRIILDDPIAEAASKAAAEMGMRASPIYAYLANSIRANGREIPYSVIAAADLGKGALASIREIKGSLTPGSLDPNESIWLTDWACRDLGISAGDPVEVDYYVWLQEGKLATRTARFHLAGIVSTAGDVDATLAPGIPGVTAARSISSWDPPFPLDLRRIRPKDEEYWNQHRATPKAFVTLARGQELWQNRFGKITAVRIALPDAADPISSQERWARELQNILNPEQAGFAVKPVREQGLAASQGSTDFGEYFVYFSSFLIAAAILLSALFFRLMIEQRVREIGILRAEGFHINVLRRIFIFEGLILSAAGSLFGLLGSIGYGWLMVFGLRTWWVGAVGTSRLFLHVSWTDLAVGTIAGMLASLVTIAWTLRGLRRNSPRSLLAGVLESTAVHRRRARTLGIVSAFSFVAAVLLLTGSALGRVSQLEGFFSAGFLLLVSILGSAALYLRRAHPRTIRGNGWPAFFRLGVRNAMHRPGRSLLCAALIASATFIIVSMEAFRRDPQRVSLETISGTGGYSLMAESALPILYDPNSTEGREALGLQASGVQDLPRARFVSFRERPGDDASCLNLYAPQEPRILGAPHSFLEDGRFSFQDSLPSSEQKRNPWLLLESPSQDGAIPAVADASTVQYILHLSVGSVLTVRGNNGAPVHLRLVAALRDSIFQGELIISESNFLRAFPEQEGYRFFLIDVSQARAAALTQPLKEALADWGFNIESSRERLSAYHRVENAYLSTFQSLGALGLILGTAGLAAILLRNVLERRQELALLRAVGYRREILSGIILSENAALMCGGLMSGLICALLSILPALHARGGSLPFVMVALILISVLIVGLASSILAVAAAFRSPLLTALRSE